MRKLIVAVTAALVAAAPAGAGGFATVGVSPLPSGDSQVWTPTLTVLAHGVTPMDGAQPVVTIRNVATGETHMFRAEPAGAVGEYHARVEFPSPGTWAYEVREWEGGTAHTFKPVEIAPPAAATPAATGPDGPWTAVAAAAILAALALLVLLGRHRRASGGAPPRRAEAGRRRSPRPGRPPPPGPVKPRLICSIPRYGEEPIGRLTE